MNTLIHICNNYVSSRVHEKLVHELSKHQAINQLVYIPIRRASDIGKNSFTSDSVSFSYQRYPGRFLRYFPLVKVIFVFIVFFRNYNRHPTPECDERKTIVLAHTLWSDGFLAWALSLIRGTSYFLVIRNTDLNWFIPKMPHYRWLIRRIIKRSAGLVFVTPCYKEKFVSRYPSLARAARDIVVIPNGVDHEWLCSESNVPTRRSDATLFVGRFDRNKNLPGVFDAVQLARKERPNMKLWLAGGSKEEFIKLTKIERPPEWVRFLGRVEDRKILRDLYRTASVLLVPSFHETFGLVYIEALSQGCPFIYTKNEGVDGLFRGDDFCVSVNPKDYTSIGLAISALANRYPFGVPDIERLRVKEFDWRHIAKLYHEKLFAV